jgi:hypothetical protein
VQKFCITPVLDHGRQYFMVNWPGKRKPWSRCAPKRQQKKFNSLERAESFLAEVKREWIRNGETSLAYDRELHYDFMRAAQLLADLGTGSSLEKGVELLRMARGVRELRGGGFVAPRDRRVELNGRSFLVVANEARKHEVTLSQMVDAIVLMWGEKEAGRRVEERMKAEELEGKLAERERLRLNAAKRVQMSGKRALKRAVERAEKKLEQEARKLNEALKDGAAICPKETVS